MCTRYPIINRVSELKVHIELTRFVQPEKIEIDANERAVNEKSQYCFFVCTTFDSFLNDLSISLNNKFHELTTLSKIHYKIHHYIFFFWSWLCNHKRNRNQCSITDYLTIISIQGIIPSKEFQNKDAAIRLHPSAYGWSLIIKYNKLAAFSSNDGYTSPPNTLW